MTKYIDAEKLIHDLEERIYAYSEGYANGDDCRKDAIETLLKDVKYQLSLQQEQPEVDIEKEIHRYFNPHGMELQFDRSKGNTILKPEQLIDFARHFFNLGLSARKV